MGDAARSQADVDPVRAVRVVTCFAAEARTALDRAVPNPVGVPEGVAGNEGAGGRCGPRRRAS